MVEFGGARLDPGRDAGRARQAKQGPRTNDFANLRAREVYKIADGYEAAPEFSLTEDGLYAALIEQKTGANRLRLINMRTGTAETLAETPPPGLIGLRPVIQRRPPRQGDRSRPAAGGAHLIDMWIMRSTWT